MTEYEETVLLADRILDRVNADPDDDLAKLARQFRRAVEKSDAEMLRVKACEHIADGDEGWEVLRELCPSTSAVARLRDRFNLAVYEGKE